MSRPTGVFGGLVLQFRGGNQHAIARIARGTFHFANPMHREVVEETALSTYDLEFLCVQEFVFDKVFYKKRRFFSRCYL